MNYKNKSKLVTAFKSYIIDVVDSPKYDSTLWLCHEEVASKGRVVWNAMVEILNRIGSVDNSIRLTSAFLTGSYFYAFIRDFKWSKNSDEYLAFCNYYRPSILAMIIALPNYQVIGWFDSIGVDWDKLDNDLFRKE